MDPYEVKQILVERTKGEPIITCRFSLEKRYIIRDLALGCDLDGEPGELSSLWL